MNENERYIQHFGVLGMRWGHRKAEGESSGGTSSRSRFRGLPGSAKRNAKEVRELRKDASYKKNVEAKARARIEATLKQQKDPQKAAELRKKMEQDFDKELNMSLETARANRKFETAVDVARIALSLAATMVIANKLMGG